MDGKVPVKEDQADGDQGRAESRETLGRDWAPARLLTRMAESKARRKSAEKEKKSNCGNGAKKTNSCAKVNAKPKA